LVVSVGFQGNWIRSDTCHATLRVLMLVVQG